MSQAARTPSRPTLRRASPLRFLVTVLSAVLCSTVVLGSVLTLFEQVSDAAVLARTAPVDGSRHPTQAREVRATDPVPSPRG